MTFNNNLLKIAQVVFLSSRDQKSIAKNNLDKQGNNMYINKTKLCLDLGKIL